MSFSRSLPLANLIACLLFVLLREPAPAWYLGEVDEARVRGAMVLDSGIWGTLACRTLNNWGPFHGGEAIGVAALEVVNLPSLLLTAIVGFFGESGGVARMTSACRWSWALAGFFIVVASSQWWFLGSAMDRRRRRLAQQSAHVSAGATDLFGVNRVWVAYAVAPVGAVVVMLLFLLFYSVESDEPVRGTALLTVAAAAAYFIGFLMLPIWWVLEKAGRRGWRYYVPAAACAGLGFSLMGGPNGAWDDYLLSVASGVACGIVFSLVLARGQRAAHN